MTRVTSPLSTRPDVATVEAATAEPEQVHLEQCFQRERRRIQSRGWRRRHCNLHC